MEAPRALAKAHEVHETLSEAADDHHVMETGFNTPIAEGEEIARDPAPVEMAPITYAEIEKAVADVASPAAPAPVEIAPIIAIAESEEAAEKKVEEVANDSVLPIADVKEDVAIKTEEAITTIADSLPEAPLPAVAVAAPVSKGFGLFGIGSSKRKTTDVAAPDASPAPARAPGPSEGIVTSFFSGIMGSILKSNISDNSPSAKESSAPPVPVMSDLVMPEILEDGTYIEDGANLEDGANIEDGANLEDGANIEDGANLEDGAAVVTKSKADQDKVKSFEILMNSSFASTTYSDKGETDDVIRPYRPTAVFSVVLFGEKNLVCERIDHIVPLLGRAKTHRVTLQSIDLKKIQKAHVACDDK